MLLLELHEIAKLPLNVALSTNQSINQSKYHY